MRRPFSPTAIAILLIASGSSAFPQAQPPNPTQQKVHLTEQGETPVFRVTVVSRSTQAINYRHRSGATTIDLRGTPLLSESRAEAKVESKQGYIEIEIEFDDLRPATQFGPEYLTYVMWAITPEGRATNLGEVLLNGTKSKLNVTTELQAFGLIVTAEPYFAVSQPSDVVVMENFVRPDTVGKVEVVDAKYELLKRGQYTMYASPGAVRTRIIDNKIPLELHEARNALELARFAGADRYAGETYQKAHALWQQAEGYQSRKAGKKSVIMTAREAVQTAEDSRLIAIQRIEEERLAEERRLAAEREALAEAKAAEETRLRQEAEAESQRKGREKAEADAARAAAERASAEAELARQRLAREKADAEAARAAAITQQQVAQLDAQRAHLAAQEANRLRQEAEAESQRKGREKAEADAARAAAERATAEAELARQRLGREKADAEAARAAAITQQQAAQLEAERAHLATQEANRLRAKAEQDRVELRERLRQQLNMILETRESARGLIVNMSDVLFDVDKHTLKPGSREKLAKVSGILLAYPGLKNEIEGHTDSTGSDEYNQQLSERRAESVRDYLISQGISPESFIATRGFGESMPVVSNDTAAGRQQNRRVELVVSGESIGELSSFLQ